jgi:two-component system, cell cycle response regulator
MTACILVVDDVPANVKLLEARLTTEFFEVKTADNGLDALRICGEGGIDVVLLDVMMPGMDGFEVCEHLKADPVTAQIPVVMVTALDQTADRVRGLKAGADDFLTKPVNDLQLMARVKSLVRLKSLTDELRHRQASIRSMAAAVSFEDGRKAAKPVHFLVVEDKQGAAERMTRQLASLGRATIVTDPQQALFLAADTQPDCLIVSTGFSGFDVLMLCSQLRALERTRSAPIILVADQGEGERIVRALEIGVNDYILRPYDEEELLARVSTQIKRKRYMDRLRENLQQTVERAVTDPLTGVSSRHFLEEHLPSLFNRARTRGQQLSILLAGADQYAAIAEEHGAEAGDTVLREFARRVRNCIRPIDLVCRYGDAEFAIVMPSADAAAAQAVAERLRMAVADEGFPATTGASPVQVTVSAGVATLSAADNVASSVLARAERAMGEARASGRNRVVALAA